MLFTIYASTLQGIHFQNCLLIFSRNQRILSLAAACAHANMIKAKFEKQTGPIIVYWIGTEELKTRGIKINLFIII
jgi:hypothetical protein